MAIGYGVACPKPEPRKRTKARKKRAAAKGRGRVRRLVFDRDHFMCRCCQRRTAETMHEIVPRSLGGKVSTFNSIALCGDGVRGCHGFCQRYEIVVTPYHGDGAVNANIAVRFTAKSPAAVEHLGATSKHSSPMRLAREAMQIAKTDGVIVQHRTGTFRNQSHRGAAVTFRVKNR